MIEIRNLKKTFTSGKIPEVNALKGISLTLPETGMVFILGKSGSGKSTLLHLLGGLDRPTDGEIFIDGKSMNAFTEKDFDEYRNKYVGFIFQEYNLLDYYSVGINVAIALELQGKKECRDDVDKALRVLELVDEYGNTLYDRRVNQLSGGQKQRVAIARVLVKNPTLILADEPTGALDSETGEQLYALLKGLSREKLIVVVSHDRESAEKYADCIVKLKDGQIQSEKEPIL